MQKKKLVLPVVLASLLATSGCAGMNNDEAYRSPNNQQTTGQNQAPTTIRAGDNERSRYGYVNYNKDELNRDDENLHTVVIDRTEIADIITRMLLRYDGFQNAATLVTDEEVLIAYHKPEDMDREKAAAIAKKTAMSVVPRFFHVYVSDEAVTFRQLQSMKNANTASTDHHHMVGEIIKDMKEAPQGDNWKPKEEDNDILTQ